MIARVSLFIFCISILNVFQSCKTEGCTDPYASNFVYEAEKDDGSCDYGGCMDPDALNFDSDARYDNGSCIYNGDVYVITTRSGLSVPNVSLVVHVNGQYMGSLSSACTSPFPTCSTGCQKLPFLDKAQGSYLLKYWEIKQTSSTTADTIYESSPKSMQVTGGECNIYVID
ncbi:MAG: hypothetical protein ACPGRC_10630 [Salibacteraceae bacterium]